MVKTYKKIRIETGEGSAQLFVGDEKVKGELQDALKGELSIEIDEKIGVGETGEQVAHENEVISTKNEGKVNEESICKTVEDAVYSALKRIEAERVKRD